MTIAAIGVIVTVTVTTTGSTILRVIIGITSFSFPVF